MYIFKGQLYLKLSYGKVNHWFDCWNVSYNHSNSNFSHCFFPMFATVYHLRYCWKPNIVTMLGFQQYLIWYTVAYFLPKWRLHYVHNSIRITKYYFIIFLIPLQQEFSRLLCLACLQIVTRRARPENSTKVSPTDANINSWKVICVSGFASHGRDINCLVTRIFEVN